MYKRSVVLGTLLVVVMGLFALPHESTPTVDGQIGAEEYQFHFLDETMQMDMFWMVDQEEGMIYVAVKVPAKGWVGWGLQPNDPHEGKKGADIIIGYVKDGQLSLEDTFGTSPVEHKPDTELGGTGDILEKAGSESEAGTIIEFKRKLATDDQFDVAVPLDKKIEVFLAYSDADDFTTYHGKETRMMVEVNFATGEAEVEKEE